MAGPYDHFRTHRQSRRLAGHDYGAPGWTFVTICVLGRRCLFGEVRDGVMALSEAGRIAHAFWAEIPEHASHARLDAFVVMPNHVHGLLGIAPPSLSPPLAPLPALAPPPSPSPPLALAPVPPLHATARPAPPPLTAPPPSPTAARTMSEMSPRAGTVSAIVRSYKSAVTRAVRPADPSFAWQPRFHDHVVRAEGDLGRIRAYIQGNPAAWGRDRFR